MVNVAVADVRPDRDGVVVAVRNGSRTARQGTVTLAHNGATVGRASFSAPAEASVDVTVPWTMATSGSISATVDDPEGFPSDNTRHRILKRSGTPTVMVVQSGDASGFFLRRALEAAAGAIQVNGVTAPEIAGGRAKLIATQAAIVLLSTRNLDRAARDGIVSFVRGGGGLFVAAAPEVEPGHPRGDVWLGRRHVHRRWRAEAGDAGGDRRPPPALPAIWRARRQSRPDQLPADVARAARRLARPGAIQRRFSGGTRSH